MRWGKEGPGVVWGWLRFRSLGLYIQWGGGLPIAFKGRSCCELEHCLATIRNDITWVDLTQKHVFLQKVVQWFVLLTDNILRLTSEAEGLFHFIAKRSGTYTFIVRAPRAWCWTGAPTTWGLGHDRARDRCHMMWLRYNIYSTRWSLLIDYTDFF